MKRITTMRENTVGSIFPIKNQQLGLNVLKILKPWNSTRNPNKWRMWWTIIYFWSMQTGKPHKSPKTELMESSTGKPFTERNSGFTKGFSFRQKETMLRFTEWTNQWWKIIRLSIGA